MNNLDVLVEKIFLYFKDINNRSYPLVLEKDEIKKVLQILNSDNDSFFILDRVDDEILGICGYFVVEKEKYLQTNLIVSFNHNKNFINKFLKHLRLSYPDYTINIGVEAGNIFVIEELKNHGYQLIDDLYSATIKPDMSSSKQFSDVKKINVDQWDNFLDIHQKYFGAGYWNFERIKNNFNLWTIFSIIENNQIKAYIFIKNDSDDDNCEIFGVYSKNIADHMRLVEHSIAALSDKKLMYYFIEEDEIKDLSKDLGFEIHGHYQSWGYNIERKD